MKKIAIVLFIAICATSCKKKACYKCTTRTYVSPSNGSTQPQSTSENVVCDMSDEDIKNYQNSMNTKATSGNVTVNQICTCSKQ